MSDQEKKQDFERLSTEDRQGLVAELVDFLKYNKKWWLTPILVILLALGALVLLAGTGAAPFVYTLF